MEPPLTLRERVEKIDKNLRIGYIGGDSFDLVKLVPIKLCDISLLETMIYMGHVFGSRPSADVIPLCVARLDKDKVMDGSIIKDIARWTTPLVERKEEAAKESLEASKKIMEQTVEEAVDRRIHEIKHGAPRNDRPDDSDITKKDKDILTGVAYDEKPLDVVLRTVEKGPSNG